MKTKLILIVMTLALVLSLSACKDADVIGKISTTSFNAVLNKIPEKVQFDEANKGWALTSPTGERFIWSKDFSTEGTPDAMIEVDAKPFFDAGLDISKFPADMLAGDKIVIKAEFGADAFTYTGEAKAIDSYKQIVKTNRDVIGYHEKLDHYGISLGNGNMFEWAKDMSTNDKDIVFVFNPQPFIDAGVDPSAVEGWVFAEVEVMDANNKKILVDKLLKPFNLD